MEKWTGLAVHSAVSEIWVWFVSWFEEYPFEFYYVCGGIRCAHKLFDEISKRNLVSWNTLMGGVSNYSAVLDMIVELRRDGICASVMTMMCVLYPNLYRWDIFLDAFFVCRDYVVGLSMISCHLSTCYGFLFCFLASFGIVLEVICFPSSISVLIIVSMTYYESSLKRNPSF